MMSVCFVLSYLRLSARSVWHRIQPQPLQRLSVEYHTGGIYVANNYPNLPKILPVLSQNLRILHVIILNGRKIRLF